MIDVLALAASAVTIVKPLLGEAAKAGAGQLGKDMAGKAGAVLGWVREKLAGKEALADAEAKPDDPLNRQALETALAKLLRDQPALADELAALVKEAGGTVIEARLEQKGDHNMAAQAAGTGNTVTIQR